MRITFQWHVFGMQKRHDGPPKNSIVLNYNLGVRRKMPFNSSSLLFYRFDLLNYRKSYLHAYWWHHCSAYFFRSKKERFAFFKRIYLNRNIWWNFSEKSQNGCWMDKFSTFFLENKVTCVHYRFEVWLSFFSVVVACVQRIFLLLSHQDVLPNGWDFRHFTILCLRTFFPFP